MKRLILSLALMLFALNAHADIRELVDADVLKQIAEETSGEAAKRNLDTITLQHRMRASSQFETAICFRTSAATIHCIRTPHTQSSCTPKPRSRAGTSRYASASRKMRSSTVSILITSTGGRRRCS